MFRNNTRSGVTFEDFLKLRRDCGTMSYFCRVFVSHVVGKVLWRRDSPTLPMSKIATVSDEAFALLAMENVWDVAREKSRPSCVVDHDGVMNPKKTMIGRYTNSSTAGKYGGWSDDGLRRFEYFMALVREDRAERGAWFDEDFLAQESKRTSAKRGDGGEGVPGTTVPGFDIDAFDEDILKAVSQYGAV
jgi:hypothetical protein